jgi:ABC-type transport system involved in cytochrome c biogenesis ATPase subunit
MKVPTLYGRDEALAQVRNELRCVLLGQGSALVVRGSAGIGKTAVLRAARSLAAESGIRVL